RFLVIGLALLFAGALGLWMAGRSGPPQERKPEAHKAVNPTKNPVIQKNTPSTKPPASLRPAPSKPLLPSPPSEGARGATEALPPVVQTTEQQDEAEVLPSDPGARGNRTLRFLRHRAVREQRDVPSKASDVAVSPDPAPPSAETPKSVPPTVSTP